MADHFIGINRGVAGATPADFTVGTSTGSTDIEVRIADAAGWSKIEIDIALERIRDHLLDATTNVEGVANTAQ